MKDLRKSFFLLNLFIQIKISSQRYSYMSAKATIQALQDSQLMHIFLDFVSTYRLQYEKQKKEISYKCFEATWNLPIAKATGYGRTETEAYKNGLKNLLELLMEDSAYSEYFSKSLKIMKPVGQDRDHSPSLKVQMKTEGHQPEDKKYVKGQLNRPKQDIHHSKINLNRSISQKGDSQLQEAKVKLKNLQKNLAIMLDENKVLRQRIMNFEQKVEIKPKEQPRYSQQPHNPSMKTISSQKSQKILQLGLGSNIGKISIPKLNLQVLPNYHKKSQKCLNQILLATYNQKHGFEKAC